MIILEILLWLLAAAGAFALYFAVVRRIFIVPYRCDEVHFVRRNGEPAAVLFRKKPREKKFPLPVVMCHGMGGNRHNLDHPGRFSLAEYLQTRGHDVWVIEWPGISSFLPKRRDRGPDFDEIAFSLVPAVISYIKETTGCKDVHWVGHSMGGMLAYVHLGAGQGKGIASLAAISSPADFSNAGWAHRIIIFGKPLRFLPAIDQHVFGAAFAPLAGLVARVSANIPLNPANMDMSLLARLMANVLARIPGKLFCQIFGWIETCSFTSSDGTRDYLAAMSGIKTPVFMLVGKADRLAPLRTVEPAFRLLGSQDKKLRLFGKATGARADYGHSDIIFGREAPDEVFPAVAEWIEEHSSELEKS